MSDPLLINDHLAIPAEDLRMEFARSGGPGGQHVNTTDSKVRLRFAIDRCRVLWEDTKARIRAARPADLTEDGELLIVCDTHRSRQMNIDGARARLADLIRAHLVPPKPRKATKTPRAAKIRRREVKTRRADTKRSRSKVGHDD